MTYLIPTNWAMIHFCYCVVHAKTGRVRHCRDLVYASIKQSRAKVYLNTKPKTQKTWCHGRCGLCNAQSNNQEQMWPQPLDTQNKRRPRSFYQHLKFWGMSNCCTWLEHIVTELCEPNTYVTWFRLLQHNGILSCTPTHAEGWMIFQLHTDTRGRVDDFSVAHAFYKL